MQIRQLPDLSTWDVQHDHSFLFDAHNRSRAQLITRWRGTVVEQTPLGAVITAWQKSIYHFGGLDREVPILVTLMLERDGRIRGVSIDERSRGSQGKRCDFPCLEKLTGSLLKDTNIAQLQQKVASAGDVKCLHLFEILAGAEVMSLYAKTNLRSARDGYPGRSEGFFTPPSSRSRRSGTRRGGGR